MSDELEFTVPEQPEFDVSFEIITNSVYWGDINGDIDDQTDLKNALDTLDGKISNNKTAIDNHKADKNNPHGVTKTQVGLGNCDNTSDLNKPISTATQTALDSKVPTSRTVNNKALTSNITLTASDVGALSSNTTINDLTTSAQQDALDSGANSTNISQIATNTQDISAETTNRQNADNALQSQIDALVVSSDVFDVVGTYAELQAYDISTVPVNDIIKVLVDSTHDNAATYYRCVENNNVKSWSYIGAEGAYYTKSEADNRFVPQTTTVNGKALSTNITLDASDVGALPSNTTIGTGILTILQNGNPAGYFNANSTTNVDINIATPTSTLDLTNDSGYITGISSSDVTTALGYTPYNSSNPNGYTSNVGTVTSVNNTQPDANGDVSISIPTNYVTTNTNQNNITGTKTFVGQKKIAFRQTSSTGSNEKLGFTCYNLNNREVGAFEYNPTYTINSVPLFTLCNSTTRAEGISYLGFRIADNTKSSASLRSAYNIVCPLADDAKTPFNLTSSFTDFYMPLGFTDGTTTVTTPNTGLVNISSLLPDISGLEQTSNKVTSISSSSTDTQYPSAKCVYDLVGDIETLINAL